MVDEWLSLSEASDQLGVSVDTLKRRIRKGEMEGRKEPIASGFRWLVRIPSDGKVPPPRAVVPINDHALRNQLAVKDEQLRQRDQEIARLTSMLEITMVEIHAAIGSDSDSEASEGHESLGFWMKIRKWMVRG